MPGSAAHSREENMDYVRELYLTLLGREADQEGLDLWVNALEQGTSRDAVRDSMRSSVEYLERNVYGGDAALLALHSSRVLLVRQLPAAEVIVDLGGGLARDERGALVAMGYPHNFKQLTIVEPPREHRHDIYKAIPDLHGGISTRCGYVNYVYGSMTDLSMFDDRSVDLVFSGETIEHVTVEECRTTLREVRRILRPTGFFCLDTPNRAVTSIKWPNAYVNPDHKVEYYHDEMVALLTDAGLTPVEVMGITHMPQTVASRQFLPEEMIRNVGLFPDYTHCYLIYYKCIPAESKT